MLIFFFNQQHLKNGNFDFLMFDLRQKWEFFGVLCCFYKVSGKQSSSNLRMAVLFPHLSWPRQHIFLMVLCIFLIQQFLHVSILFIQMFSVFLEDPEKHEQCFPSQGSHAEESVCLVHYPKQTYCFPQVGKQTRGHATILQCLIS